MDKSNKICIKMCIFKKKLYNIDKKNTRRFNIVKMSVPHNLIHGTKVNSNSNPSKKLLWVKLAI